MTNGLFGASWLAIASAAVIVGLSACGPGNGGAAPDCHSVELDGFFLRASLFKTDDAPRFALSATVTGEVVEVGLGSGEGPCDHDNWHGVQGEKARARVVDDNGVSWTVCVVGFDFQPLGLTMPLEVGQTVTVEARYLEDEFGVFESGLNLRVDGQLVLYALGDAWGGGSAKPAELSFSAGEELCRTEPGSYPCGESAHDLVASAGGDEVTMSPGDTAAVGDYEVHFGAWSDSLSDGGCDQGGNHSLFVLRKP